ncbi:hypothetical protein M011DRAFT_99449 [Sporormia fimetaria CBS 119925]|uniref:Uncharacterized protein n=1 Tax=Sporormia fimetaria CBS 119925 TaxID=1340428 RepID=A0A6A6V6L6_9PLEO|nr:hypothetical protein M011DRAFT_99449 [Sporormia fimetaria CBS 119925]
MRLSGSTCSEMFPHFQHHTNGRLATRGRLSSGLGSDDVKMMARRTMSAKPKSHSGWQSERRKAGAGRSVLVSVVARCRIVGATCNMRPEPQPGRSSRAEHQQSSGFAETRAYVVRGCKLPLVLAIEFEVRFNSKVAKSRFTVLFLVSRSIHNHLDQNMA